MQRSMEPKRKYLVLLGDGMADWPLPDYDNKTPLELAKTPHMDSVAEGGVLGQFYPIPEGLPAGSDVGNLSVFGYDPRNSFRGRAPIEAARQGISLAENEVAFRCNLVTLEDGAMHDFTAGHISTEEGREIIAALQEALSKEFPVAFHPGVSYRHLCFVQAEDQANLEALADLACTPPHDISGQAWEPHLPQGDKAAALMRALILRSQEILPTLPVNQARVAQGLLPATSVWFWGQGRAPSMQSYAEKFGLSGAVISAVDLINGIGVCADLEVIDVPGATGWIDTNYAGKINAALEALDRHDFVYVHVEAPDETGHQGRVDLKVQAIEDFDAKIVGPALAYLESHPELRILVAPDHFTTIETRTHAGGAVPFALCGAGIAPQGGAIYSERVAAQSGIVLKEGHRLIQRIIEEETPSF